jgi:hypothetical protein
MRLELPVVAVASEIFRWCVDLFWINYGYKINVFYLTYRMKAPIIFVHDAFEIVAIRNFIFEIFKWDKLLSVLTGT